jgi:hypothetical protein
MEVNNTMAITMRLTKIIISSINGEEIGHIIVDREKESTINELFNVFIKNTFNDRLYKTDIKILNDLSVLYSYYDQSIGNKSIYIIDLSLNEIYVSIIFTDEFKYISYVTLKLDGESIYNIDSYHNLTDYKKKEITKLLDKLTDKNYLSFNNTDDTSEFFDYYIEKFYDHIIITKFIAMILLKKGFMIHDIVINQLDENFGNDREIVNMGVSRFGMSLQYASIELRNDKEIVKNAVYNNGDSLEFASLELRNNKEIVKIALTFFNNSLQFASNELRDDREIVSLAVLINGCSLRYASNKLRDDREIVILAVSQNSSALRYASNKLRDDREIVNLAASLNSS